MPRVCAIAALAVWVSVWLCSPVWSQAVVNESLETATLYVDVTKGSDGNPGTQQQPLKTIGAAASKAMSNKAANIGTKVIINPGLYRESITLNGTKTLSTLPITFEAATNGTVFVTGASQWTGWSIYNGNQSIYTKTWPYRWGLCPIDTGNPPLEEPVVLRREMIVVNGVLMTQVMALSQMIFPGTFFVDETAGLVYLWPPAGTNIATADVEVGINANLWVINAPTPNQINGIVIRGITFEYANSCHTDSAINVLGHATNLWFDSDTFLWNNGSGLNMNTPVANVTVSNTTANHNGESGFNTYQIKNVEWTSDTASYNNWRGAQGAFYEWGSGGAHIFSDHTETLTNFTAVFNQTHSVHWDTNNTNLSVTNMFSAENMFGVLLEKNNGPITFTNNNFCSSSVPSQTYGAGIILRDTLNATISNNVFYNTGNNAIEVTGILGGYVITDWETNQTYTAINENDTLTGNILQGSSTNTVLFQDGSLGGTDWTTFVSTLKSDRNTWWNAADTNTFMVPTPVNGTMLDFAGWQLASGQDLNSTWTIPGTNYGPLCTVTADGPDYWLLVDNGVVTTDAAGNAFYNLTTYALGGMTGTVKLAVDGVSSIPGASYSLSSPTMTTSDTAVLTFNAGPTTPPGSYTFTVLANAGSVTRMITLSATVPVSSVRLSTDQLSFDNVPVGAVSAGQDITLTNTGTSALSITKLAIAYGFSETDTCGTSVASGKTCTITVTFSPKQLQSYAGSLTITDSDATSPQTVTLNGTTIGSAGVKTSPGSLSFGAAKFLSPTASQTITVTNNGTATLNVSSVAITGANASDFTQTNTCLKVGVPVNATCTISVVFDPTWTGQRNASVTITDNALTSPQTVAVSGTGQAALSLSSKSLGFGTVKIGSSATRTATLTNAGTSVIPINSITVTGANSSDFTQTNNCGKNLAANSSCTITVVCAPSISATLSASVSIADTDPSSPQTLSLTATGEAVPLVVLAPVSLTFSGQVYKSPSTAQNVTITNTGTASLSITRFSFGGMNGSDFSQTNDCNGSVAVGKSCTVSVTFKPTGLGARTANLNISDNATGSPQSVALTGTGLTALTISPTAVNFGSVPMGSSGVQTVTISNASTSAISFTSATISGTAAGDFTEKNSCGTTIKASGNCTVTVTFTPLAIGTRTATLTLTDLDPTSPQTVSLTGTAEVQPVVTFSPTSLSFGNEVYLKPTAPLTTTMKNTTSSPMSITKISITGSNKADFTESDNCGTLLAANASCLISITFTPGSTGSRTGTISVTDDAVGSPQTVSLSGTGVTAITVAPASLDFGTVTVNATASLPLTVTNASTAPISVTSLSLGGTNGSNFSQTNTCGSSIPGNSSCTVTVSFTPKSSGSKSGTLTISDSDPSKSQKVTLSGTGANASPGVEFSPAWLAFGSVVYQNSSPVMSTTLTNNGTATLNLTSVSITGASAHFSQTNTCGSTLAAGASCTMNVTFTPVALGAFTANISVADNATGSPQTVALSGTGLSALTISPSSLNLGTVSVGSTSTQSLTLTNASAASITVTSLVFSGTNATDFSQTSTCGTKIAGNSSCSVNVSFKPGASGTRSGTLTITDSDPGSPQTVKLSGTGSGAPTVTFSPSSLTFGNEPYEKPSAPMVTTMTNTGTASLSITSITLMGTNTADFTKTTTCGSSLAAGASCTITITFVPAALGARSASISVSDSGLNSPQSVPLSGTGIAALTISPAALSFGLVNTGAKTTLQATVTNASSASIGVTNFTFSGTNAGDFSQTNTCGSSVAGNASCTITVTFQPAAAGSRSASLMITDSDPSSPQTITLSGTGGTPAILLAPLSLSFGAQPLTKTSPASVVTITNTGTGLLNITSLAITGGNASDYSQTSTCTAAPVKPGANCTINVTFTPSAVGTRAASISLTDNVIGSPQTIPLTGIGSALSITPLSIDFGSVKVGASSTTIVTVMNLSTASVSVQTYNLSGTNSTDVAQTNTCGHTILAGATCTVSVRFKPAAAGLRTAQLNLDDNDPSSPQVVTLTGTGQ